MVSRGGVAPFDGDLDDYQRYLLDEAKRLRAEATVAAQAVVAAAQSAAVQSAAVQSAAVQKKTTTQAGSAMGGQRKEDAQLRKALNEKKRPLKKELDAVEQSIATLEAEQASLHQQLSTTLTPADLAQAGKRLKVVEAELAELEMRWLALGEAMEAL